MNLLGWFESGFMMNYIIWYKLVWYCIIVFISNHKKMCNKNWSYGIFYPITQFTVKLIHTILHEYELINDGIQYHIIILKIIWPLLAYYDIIKTLCNMVLNTVVYLCQLFSDGRCKWSKFCKQPVEWHKKSHGHRLVCLN